MDKQVKLPYVNENGCYEIRLESLGGLGANLCGKMLGELGAVSMGLNAASFSSYGSEKRGSPVKAHIRWSEAENEIRINSPVENPHILGAFYEAFMANGISAQTRVVINTKKSAQEVRERRRLPSTRIYCIDALRIAMETKSRVNMVMLGAIIKAAEFIPLDIVEELAKKTVGKKYPALISKNLEGLRQGYEKALCQRFDKEMGYPDFPYREPENAWGYQNAPIGGINTIYGNTVTNELSGARQGYIPLFIQEKCINCGLCDSTCPDMVFQFVPGEYRGKRAMVNAGLDYHHCKGCLRCVRVCPTNALVQGLEREHREPEWFVRNKDLIVEQLDFEKAGANAWITSESYLTEKRIEGGAV